MVKNTGYVEGKDVPQLYIGRTASKVLRPVKELKAFDKISLMPQEEKEVIFTLERGAFAYYSVCLKRYHIESGNYMIYIGSSSKDIKLKKSVNVTGEDDFL